MKYIFRALETAAAVMPWFMKATADGKVTVDEMAEFISLIARIWKIDVTIALPPSVKTNSATVKYMGVLPEDE